MADEKMEKKSPFRIRQSKAIEKAKELKRQGWTYMAIAVELGLSILTVEKYVKRT